MNPIVFTNRSLSSKRSGFTLIELMVTISIIMVLTAVIMVAGEKARIVSRNAERTATAVQYKNALALAYDDRNAFPNSGGDYMCLDESTCWAGTHVSNSSVNAAIAPYISGTPLVADVTNLTYTGVLFYSDGGTSPGYLTWFLEGTNKSCAPGTLSGDPNAANYGGNTWCFMTISL